MAAPIQGKLAFPTAGADFFNTNDLAGNYARSYLSAKRLNEQNYSNILEGYQQAMGQSSTVNDLISAGYTDLANQVQQQIAGSDQGQKTAIQDQYLQASAKGTQDLISKGLGNSTVTSAIQRGYESDKQKALAALAGQMAQLQATYKSQLGQAGLAQRSMANQQYTALAKDQLGFQERVNAPYPSADAYANLARQRGQARQAQMDAQRMGMGAQPVMGPQGGQGGGGQRPQMQQGGLPVNRPANQPQFANQPPNLVGQGQGGGGGREVGMKPMGPFDLPSPPNTTPGDLGTSATNAYDMGSPYGLGYSPFDQNTGPSPSDPNATVPSSPYDPSTPFGSVAPGGAKGGGIMGGYAPSDTPDKGGQPATNADGSPTQITLDPTSQSQADPYAAWGGIDAYNAYQTALQGQQAQSGGGYAGYGQQQSYDTSGQWTQPYTGDVYGYTQYGGDGGGYSSADYSNYGDDSNYA